MVLMLDLIFDFQYHGDHNEHRSALYYLMSHKQSLHMAQIGRSHARRIR